MAVAQKMKDCVGYLSVQRKQRDRKGRRWAGAGTCFFVAKHDRKQETFDFLVTAKHVIEEARRIGLQLHLRVNRRMAKPGEPGVRYFPLPDKWILHNDSAVDLAVLPWSTNEADVQFACLDIDGIVEQTQRLLQGKSLWPPLEGTEVLYVAMTVQIHGLDRNYPILRTGRVALVAGERINGQYGLADYLVIDCQSFKGNSGAPVWASYDWEPSATEIGFAEKDSIQPNKLAYLYGVLVGAWPEAQEVYRTRRDGKTVIEEYHNLGISLVTPVQKIIDIIESKGVQKIMEKDKLDIEALPVPLSAATIQGDLIEVPDITKQEFERVLRKAKRRRST
jgi:hypothetical protein